ncbi:6-hydroxymethylpterin diphosphokinase MptE-like protein [Crocosphaera sp. XPORK-15E]|uniref:6-hydroxymethylpterin diphosphokinase MptE-like protein n=1 Tax=Crocosphaera sp. XPORK-15E TaxID=3110247 RepID=UPI002B219903|nr:6-hydroxymethylpterin diphosphokinase MptE-like protein [Crocosphaera sp. XPORK-15E]MEA5533267.1 6-hydroxymethylpterin diphosphokinase MptE-like protein [Crocosphaera sp. XPORK-15E]
MNTILSKSLEPLKERVRLALNYSHDVHDYGIERAEYYEWYLKHSKRLQQFKNCHRGESCFIIGNGPSLNQMDLNPLKEVHTFGLNKIYLIFEKVNLNLSYHVSVNPLVIEQSVNNFTALSCPSFLSFKSFCEYRKKQENPLNIPDNLYFVLTSSTCHFSSNIAQKINEGYTVTYVAMQIAFYMGFKQVFLIGVDHNFKAVGKPNEKQTLKGDDMNHFSPNYFANKEWQLPDLEGSELSYRIAKFNYERSGRIIYDATVDGKLEIFPKISYEEALSLCNKK